MNEEVRPDRNKIDLSFSKPFVLALIIGTILWTVGIILWQHDENYYFASMVLIIAGVCVETYGFIIKMRENKKSALNERFMEGADSDFFKRHTLSIGCIFIIFGIASIVLGICMSLIEFSGESAWLNEPGAWILIAVLGMAFVLGGFAGVMDVIAERDAKFAWVDMPKEFTGRPEPLMRYERMCPICSGIGFLEAQKLHDGRINLLTFHARCNSCKYDVVFPWLSRGFVFALFCTLIIAGILVMWLVYLKGGLMPLWELAFHWFSLFVLGVVLYMVSNYLVLRSKMVNRHIDKRIVQQFQNWHTLEK